MTADHIDVDVAEEKVGRAPSKMAIAKEKLKDVACTCMAEFYQDEEVGEILPEPVPGVQMRAPEDFPKSSQVLLGYQMFRKFALTLCCGQRLDVSNVTLFADTVCLPMGWMCCSMPMSWGKIPPGQRPVYGTPEQRAELERIWPKGAASASAYVAPNQGGMKK